MELSTLAPQSTGGATEVNAEASLEVAEAERAAAQAVLPLISENS